MITVPNDSTNLTKNRNIKFQWNVMWTELEAGLHYRNITIHKKGCILNGFDLIHENFESSPLKLTKRGIHNLFVVTPYKRGDNPEDILLKWRVPAKKSIAFR